MAGLPATVEEGLLAAAKGEGKLRPMATPVVMLLPCKSEKFKIRSVMDEDEGKGHGCSSMIFIASALAWSGYKASCTFDSCHWCCRYATRSLLIAHGFLVGKTDLERGG